TCKRPYTRKASLICCSPGPWSRRPATGRRFSTAAPCATGAWKLSLGVVPIESRLVHWNATFNFSLNRCVIDSLPVAPFPATGVRKQQGKSCTQYVGADSLGRLPGDAALGTIGSRIVRQITDLRPDYLLSWANDLGYRSL